MFLDARTDRVAIRRGCRRTPRGLALTLQKPSISKPFETRSCFVGVFHALNQRHAQLYYSKHKTAQLPKLDVAGSNPVSRSIFSSTYKDFGYPPNTPLSRNPLIA